MAPTDDDRDGTVSRRDFFKTVGVSSIATSVLSVPLDAQTAGPQAFGPGNVPVRLVVNGKAETLQIEPRVTLLDAVRNRLDLTGNKRVCDRGTCGACTMIVDGRAIYSCSTLAIDVQGKQIRTVDGLAKGDTLHPVQQAFCDVDGLMCGFCTPGFVMATVAMLEKYPKPTDAQIKRELDGNVCRCGTFVGIREAARRAGGRPSSARSAAALPRSLDEGGREAARG
jgi:xanthine dehydrogenase YagT iron-sulfur-binding subunit